MKLFILFISIFFCLTSQAQAQNIDLFPCYRTGLNRAAMSGSSEEIREEVDKLEFNQQDKEMRRNAYNLLDRALSCAVPNDNEDAFFELLKSGADIGFVATGLVKKEGKILKSLLKKRLYLQLILERASYLGALEVVKQSIEQGAKVNFEHRGSLPLCRAAERNRIDVVKFLISRGADANLSEVKGRAPIHSASSSGNLEVISLLLENGADVNKQSSFFRGGTAIHHAKDSKTLELLIKNGAKIDLKNKKGFTALHNAVVSSDLSRVKTLLKFGANPNLKTNSGKTAFLLSKSESLTKVLKENSKHEIPKIDELKQNSLLQAISLSEKRKCPRSKELEQYKKDGNLNHQDIFGMSAFHYATMKECEEIVSSLIKDGAKINLLDKMGRTALDVGRMYGMTKELSDLLISSGAKPGLNFKSKFLENCYYGTLTSLSPYLNDKNVILNDKDEHGNTCLHLEAVRRSSFQSISLLLKEGANPNLKNNYGMTPKGWAIQILKHMKLSRQEKEWAEKAVESFNENETR